MADDTNTAEREAAERWLRDRYGAYRGHFAWRKLEEAFLAGRASLAASAGSEPEPFGHWFTDDPKSFAMPGSGFLLGKEPPKDAINVIPVYTHPSPPEGMAGLPTRNELALQLLVAGGFVTEKKLAEALALVDAACPALSPQPPASEAKEL